MNAEETMKKLHGIGIIPAIVINNVEDAAPLARALVKGGLPVAEVTYRSEQAHDAMIAMKKECPGMIVGAGTVLTKEQVDSAVDAGAEFIVAPGLNPELVEYVQSKGLPMIPGVSSASEIDKAVQMGLHVLKFFPAEQLGGIKTIKALCGPYRNVTFVPTGGVNTDNLLSYIRDPKIFAVGGTWMVKEDLIKKGEFDRIAEISHDAVMKMLGMYLKHIGVNCDTEYAESTAMAFADILQGKVRKTSKGYFGSEFVEIMSGENYWQGTKGHIGIGVTSVERAMAYYNSIGVEFDESSITYKDGEPNLVYFKDEIAGFAIHLVKD